MFKKHSVRGSSPGKILSLLVALIMAFGTSAGLAGGVYAEETDYEKLHIASVYGGRIDEEGEDAGGVGASHSFVEIYNPNDFDVELDGYTLFYQGFPTQFIHLRNGWDGFALPDETLPAKHSFLINCGENEDVSGQLILEQLTAAMSTATIRYGRMIRRKLIPLESIATISVCPAIFEVKNMTAMKAKSPLNMLTK